jgi:magnesium-transporting ATPase (P-type)
MCKGSDAKMMPLIEFESEKQKNEIKKHLHEFAVEGLRTLMMARRELTEDDYKSIEVRWNELSSSNAKDKDE